MARFINPSVGTGDTTHHTINVKNGSTYDTISKGAVVMFDGADGDTVKVVPADATANPEYLVGIAHEDIIPEAFGEIVQFGTVEHVKTDYAGWQLGDLLYLDPAVPGALTNTPQQAPNWDFPIAAITRVHPETGRVLVRGIPQVGNATVINTDGNASTKIYVGSVDPSTLYTLEAGDVWIETV